MIKLKKQKALIIVFLVISLLLSGCENWNIDGNAVKGETIKFANETFPYEVAKLPELELDSINRFEDYKAFADRMNILIEILNRQIEYDIPLFPATQNVWSKVSTTITKYGPLVNNYNEVVHSAKKYASSGRSEDKKEFYIATARFGFETTLIVWAVFYSAAYNSVGIVYRSIGLNRLAFSHPVLVKTLLSSWHWILRTALVESASYAAINIFNGTLSWYNEIGEIEGVKQKTSNFINQSSSNINSFITSVS
ncbi:MAG: hypothetical protein HQ538_06865 [Parcubacteria group bacterium]|nr:hypothetical protein [Parcubacteria group bacterium]